MINRDGACTSLWQGSSIPYQPKSTADGKNQYDVIIVGGGITGISTALLLQEAGKSCLVAEAANLCFGTTGGTTAHLNTLLDTPYSTMQKNFNKAHAAGVAKSVKAAIQLIKHNIQRLDIDCGFSDATAFLFAQDEQQEKELEDIATSSEEVGLSLSYTNDIPVPIEFTKALKIEGQAQFSPIDYVYGLATAFENAGGVILQDCRITGAEKSDPTTVETTRGVFKTTDLVYATHTPPGVNLLHLRCMPYRSYAMAVILQGDSYPSDLSYDMVDPYHYYRTQEIDGQRYLIAGGKDHKTGNETNTDRCFQELEAHIRKYFAVAQVAYKWSSQYFEPTDGLPYIGHMPGSTEHIFVACGYGGNGMVYSSVAAMLLKSLVLGESSEYTNLFDPSRIKPVAGFTNFIKHNASVVKEFAGKLFSGEKLGQLAELSSGEGKLVTYEGTKLAMYKNENGKLYALNPVCQHMKCTVKWNQAERSWDCPCHGARYGVDGQLLTGPADGDLEVVQLSEHIGK